jgi:AP endonuclease-2
VDGYDAYYSFARTKAGYAGVATYIKHPWHEQVRGAEEGLSGRLHSTTPLKPAVTCEDLAWVQVQMNNTGLDDISSTNVADMLHHLDLQGRCLVIDLGVFVLFNLYAPHESSPARLPEKLCFCYALERRIRQFLVDKRQVCVAGDLNIAPTRLDHCDPEGWERDHPDQIFEAHPPRAWLTNITKSEGPLIDLIRQHHPTVSGLYTCWNTKINARQVRMSVYCTNYSSSCL